MKRVLLGGALCLLTFLAQAQTFYAPGTRVSRLDTATVDGVFYKLGRKASAPGITDSFTIKEISLRRFEGEMRSKSTTKRVTSFQ